MRLVASSSTQKPHKAPKAKQVHEAAAGKRALPLADVAPSLPPLALLGLPTTTAPTEATRKPWATRLTTTTTTTSTTTTTARAITARALANPHAQNAIGTGLPSVREAFPAFVVDDTKAARALQAVRVHDTHGAAHSLLSLLRGSCLSSSQQRRVVACFAEVAHSLSLRGFDASSADIHWKHLCAEAAVVVELGAGLGLSAKDTETALLGSLFSDAVKFPSTLLTHNLDGATAAAWVLSRRGDVDEKQIAGVVAVALEHQIGPPRFMARELTRQLLSTSPPPDHRVIEAIEQKVSQPYAYADKQADGYAVVAFSDDEKALLRRVGIDDWHVPQPGSAWFGASQLVIAADSVVNYAMPEGVGKIVALSGPGTAFACSVVDDAFASVDRSAIDARTLLPAPLRALYDAAHTRTAAKVKQTMSELRTLLASGSLLNVKVPGVAGHVPYVDCAVQANNEASEAFAVVVRSWVADRLREVSER